MTVEEEEKDDDDDDDDDDHHIIIIIIFIHIYCCDVVYHDLYHIYSHDIMIVMVVNTMLYNRVKAISELIGSHSQLLSLPY